MENKIIDHLFRHQHGKMVSILTRIFGLKHLEIIEDAVQDTFVTAMLSWRNQIPENPEAWLTKAAKNRMIDLFRKLSAEQKRAQKFESGPATIAIEELFLDSEIQDSQLRMIFTACHPFLNPKDQIAFALKTISGFSSKEIASALLQKEDAIKKRLTRARKSIKENDIAFEIPKGKELPKRLNRVLEILYLIFNEGFHSNKKAILIRKELCGEAVRLCKMLLTNKLSNHPPVYALFALFCFHAARLDSKINEAHELLDLRNQDRSLWYQPLIALGHSAMEQAVQTENFTSYHYEAAIAAEHLYAPSFETTNWDKILMWHEQLYALQATPITLLNMAIIQLERNAYKEAHTLLEKIDPKTLAQRTYLYYGAYAEYFIKKRQIVKAIYNLDIALKLVQNEAEKQYLMKKKASLLN